MAFIGNLEGPRESLLLGDLGHDYFGLTPEELDVDIRLYEDTEARNQITAVHVDERGQPFIPVRRHGQWTNFYLEENGCMLKGEIRTYTASEAERWRKRCADGF